jgi:hypothetical protein
MESRFESEVGVEAAREAVPPPLCGPPPLRAPVDEAISLLRSPGKFSLASVVPPPPSLSTSFFSCRRLLLFRLLRQQSQMMTMRRMRRMPPIPAAIPTRTSVVKKSAVRVGSPGTGEVSMVEEDRELVDSSELVLQRKKKLLTWLGCQRKSNSIKLPCNLIGIILLILGQFSKYIQVSKRVHNCKDEEKLN